jgi:hypothetical protein
LPKALANAAKPPQRLQVQVVEYGEEELGNIPKRRAIQRK